eukprot:570822-Prorocentrum_minimum.AAC.1
MAVDLPLAALMRSPPSGGRRPVVVGLVRGQASREQWTYANSLDVAGLLEAPLTHRQLLACTLKFLPSNGTRKPLGAPASQLYAIQEGQYDHTYRCARRTPSGPPRNPHT